MNVGSLFAGIGGFDLGLERAGMRTVWQVEKEPFRRAILARHFPAAERFADVREVGIHNLARVDVVCGGFPCKDLSLAGRGGGLAGAHSGLWSEYARIVGELRPRYVVVENVPALLGRGLGRVLGDLAACGYDAEWDCLPASAFGAPHLRDRLWIVAYPARQRQETGRPGAGATPLDDCGSDARRGSVAGSNRRGGSAGELADASEPGSQGHGRGSIRAAAATGRGAPSGDVADPEGEPVRAGLRESGSGRQRGRRSGNGGSTPDSWAAEPDVGRVADGVPARVDRLSALGDALVPQIAEWLGRRILMYEGGE